MFICLSVFLHCGTFNLYFETCYHLLLCLYTIPVSFNFLYTGCGFVHLYLSIYGVITNTLAIFVL